MNKRIALTSLILAILLLIAQSGARVDATSVTVKNSFQLNFVTDDGNSNFTIFYSFPQQVTHGQNFTLSFYMYVTALTGLAGYLNDYGLTVTLAVGNGQPISGSLYVQGGLNGSYLYEGARWGPVSITVPISPSLTDQIPSGQTVNASIAIAFSTDVYFLFTGAAQTGAPYPESGQQLVGYVLLSNTSKGSSLIYFAIALVLVVAVIGYVVLIFRRNSKRSLNRTNPEIEHRKGPEDSAK